MRTEGETTKTVFGACPHDCPDGCAMLFDVADGKLIKVRGNPNNSYTTNRLCAKLNDYDKHHYNPDRLLYPMRRAGKKGSGRFERISWDQALDQIRDTWQDLIEQYSAESILPYGYAGNLGLLNGMNSGDAFFNRLGATTSEKTFCASGNVTAQLMTIGPTLGTDPESFIYSKYIVVWGANPISTHSHLWPFILRAQRNGAKVVVIDPFRTRTAARADWHIAPRPGTDAVLALSMIDVLVKQKLIDHDYIDNYCLGFDELAASAADYPPERAAEITGIPARDIEAFASEYAQTQPSVIRVGVGLERYPSGGQAIRAIDCLPALTGAWRQVGGGLLQMPIFVPSRGDYLSRPDWIDPNTRVLNITRIGELLNDADLSPPIKSVMIWNANPLTQAPDANNVARGLAREDLFTIVSEHFMTDTARYADLLLPATMAAEQDDILTAWGHFHINLNVKAIEAPGEAIPNSELFRRLAGRFGYDDDSRFTLSDVELLQESLDWNAPLLAGRSWNDLQEHGTIRVNVPPPDQYAPHAAGNFPTPSGKCEFVSDLGAQHGYVGPPLRQGRADKQNSTPISRAPDYTPNIDSVSNAKYPLQLLSPKSHGFLNSEYANEAHKVRVQGEQAVMINATDANARRIRDGDEVQVVNNRGKLIGSAKISDKVLTGTVVAHFGYWKSQNKADAVNALTAARSGFAGTPGYYDVNVELELVHSPICE